MIRRAVLGCQALLLLLASQPDLTAAVVLRGHAAEEQAVEKTNTTRYRDLPSECNYCRQRASPLDPTSQYCGDLYQECGCCRSRLQDLKAGICRQFMGYGGCIEGIKAAMNRKDEQCRQRQALDDWNKQQDQKEVDDALRRAGYPRFVAQAANSSVSLNAKASLNASTTLGPYDSECWDCKANKALCAPSYGCNRQLWAVEHDYTLVKNYYEMYQNKPCFR